MNLRNVLRAFSSLRQLTDDESAFLQTLRSMSDTERELLVESLQPEKSSGKKKSSKKASGGGKSQRASNMAATLNKNLAQQRQPTLCTYVLESGETCSGTENDQIHDKSMGYAGYHPFVSSSSARSAAGQSSTNGDEVSSETGKEDVSSVAGAGD